MNKVLVTGANGFVGRALVQELQVRGIAATGAVRGIAGPGQCSVGDIGAHTDWRRALSGCDTVFHLAARVHVMADQDADPLAAYREVNVTATLVLAHQAAAAGVRRFVFVSSVKVNGEATTAVPFRASDAPAPCDPYGVSKMEAERALLALAAGGQMEMVIVRPPLVYGPGVKANFLNLMKLVRLGLPLPFGSVRNRRSMVALDNLVDLLIVCGTHRAAAGQVFMVSDGEDLSMPDLVRLLGSAFGRRPLLLPVPASWLAGAARLAGKSAVAERVLGSLQVDIAATRATLGWSPPVTPAHAAFECVRHFEQARRNAQG